MATDYPYNPSGADSQSKGNDRERSGREVRESLVSKDLEGLRLWKGKHEAFSQTRFLIDPSPQCASGSHYSKVCK